MHRLSELLDIMEFRQSTPLREERRGRYPCSDAGLQPAGARYAKRVENGKTIYTLLEPTVVLSRHEDPETGEILYF